MHRQNSFILGTAQLGMPYGIANNLGQPNLSFAKGIIATALNAGITYFDTAQMYGTSETVLGQCLQVLNSQNEVKIITKVASESLQDKVSLGQAFSASLQNLDVQSLYCFMLHHEEYLTYLDGWQGDFLLALQKQEKIIHLGISVYYPEKALQALEHPLIHIVQVPSSLFDKRFIEAGVFKRAKELKKEIHIRSVFLQGVLCMSPASLPDYLKILYKYVKCFHGICNRYNCTPSQGALAWMQNKEPEALLIFGAESIKQVQENMDIEWQKKCNMQDFLLELDNINVPQEPELLNPSLWKR